MRVHALSTQPQFWRHLRPIYNRLPLEVRGNVLDGSRQEMSQVPDEDVVMVAGYGNVVQAGWRRVIYVEHGAGQSYKNARAQSRPHYPGGLHPSNVIGYICPNETVAAAWDRPAVVAGCPALDSASSNGHGNRIVFTFHWDGAVVSPEARSARSHYLDDLHVMIQWARSALHMEPLGHWHPRDHRAERIWDSIGVETEKDPDICLQKAGLVIADNTSFAYEAAFLGIPNVALNAPWYRKHVNHGLRFWEHPPGLMVDDAYELMGRSPDDWRDDRTNVKIRQAAARRAYGAPRGGGARRAVDFIMDLVG